MGQKDVNVELLRLLACLLVIVVHIRPAMLLDGKVMNGALLMQTLTSVAVGSFFLISGFFTPNSPSVRKTWKRFLSGVLGPAFCYVIAVMLLNEWIASRTGILESLAAAFSDLPGLLGRLFRGTAAFNAGEYSIYTGHLWFVFSYALIMLWFPIIRLLIRNGTQRVLLFFVLLAFYRLLIIDITNTWPIPMILYLPELVPVEVLCFVIGYLLYQRREKLSGRLLVSACLCGLLLLLFCAMFLLQKNQFVLKLSEGVSSAELNLQSPYYLSWNSGLGVVASTVFAAFILSLPTKGERLSGLIRSLGSLTYPVYLVHFAIVAKLISSGVNDRVQEAMHAQTAAGAVLYTLSYALFIFLLSGALVLLLRAVRRQLARCHKS